MPRRRRGLHNHPIRPRHLIRRREQRSTPNLGVRVGRFAVTRAHFRPRPQCNRALVNFLWRLIRPAIDQMRKRRAGVVIDRLFSDTPQNLRWFRRLRLERVAGEAGLLLLPAPVLYRLIQRRSVLVELPGLRVHRPGCRRVASFDLDFELGAAGAVLRAFDVFAVHLVYGRLGSVLFCEGDESEAPRLFRAFVDKNLG